MPWYTVITPLSRGAGKKPAAPGAIVELDEDTGGTLVALDAVKPAEGPREAAPPPPPSPSPPPPPSPPTPSPSVIAPQPPAGTPLSAEPLDRQSKAELLATAAAEGLSVEPHTHNRDIVAAIKAKRARAAA